jgi:hypothetical protein
MNFVVFLASRVLKILFLFSACRCFLNEHLIELASYLRF